MPLLTLPSLRRQTNLHILLKIEGHCTTVDVSHGHVAGADVGMCKACARTHQKPVQLPGLPLGNANEFAPILVNHHLLPVFSPSVDVSWMNVRDNISISDSVSLEVTLPGD